MRHRYRISHDFMAALGTMTNWAIYDTQDPRHGTDDEWPFAVFAKRSDAIAFRSLKESK